MDNDMIGKIHFWKHILDLYEEMLIEGISSEPDEAFYSANLNELIDILTRTVNGEDWNRFKVTDHSKKTTVQLEIKLKFARYKKPKVKALD